MSRPRSSFINMAVSLGLFTLIAGALLGLVHNFTSEPVERARIAAVNEAIAAVVPPFDNDPASDIVRVVVDGREVNVYPATRNGGFVGAAVEGRSANGFSGDITVMFGFDAGGHVSGYRVLSHAETPGLGARMDDWFHQPVGRRSVIGADPANDNLRVAKDGGDIDGITAATISSRAFLEALRSAYATYKRVCLDSLTNVDKP